MHHQHHRLGGLRRLLRAILYLSICLCLSFALSFSAEAARPNSPEITVYRDPGCRCCEGWVEHLTAQGFQTHVIPTADMDSLKQQLGVPTAMGSCHTALVDGYLLEGHVPVADLQRLLAERPDVAGIAVPGMPVGTPGMEDGDHRDSFDVFSFKADESEPPALFQHYQF
jgi:hypothetical protein